MNISTDFLIRIVGAQDGYRIPVLKPKLEDENTMMTMKICGDHQNYLDLSRCNKLSSHFIISIIPFACPNILHLDLSYTRTDDLQTFFTNCIYLKTLNLAGLSLSKSHLQGIQQIRTLEVLSLRGCNIDDITAVEELSCLRSLDCGVMRLKKIGNALKEKDRLEELLFDETQFENEQSISDVLDYVGSLVSLKLLNIVKSDLEKEMNEIHNNISIPVYFEPKTRKELFFRALIQNQVNEAYFYITSGQDINAKIERTDELWLTDIWIQRCYHAKTRLQTPFFIFHPILEEIDDVFTVYDYLPNGLHLALFFNSIECVQMLLANNIDVEEEVYISDVLYEKTEKRLYEEFSYGSNPDDTVGKRVLLTSSKSQKNIMIDGADGMNYRSSDPNDNNDPFISSQQFLMKKLYKITEYIHYLYQKNVHRFTENLILKKVSNWKSICDRFKKRLLYLVDTYDPTKIDMSASALRGNDSFKVMSIEELNSRQTFAINMKTGTETGTMVMTDIASRPTTAEVTGRKEEGGGGGGGTERKDDQSPIGQITKITTDTPSAASSPVKKLNRGVSFASLPTTVSTPNNNKQSDESVEPTNSAAFDFDNFNPEQLPILQAFNQQQQQKQQRPSQSQVGPPATSRSDNDSGKMDNEQDPFSSKDRPNILPAKPKLFPWYQHGLVHKIIGAPKIYKTRDLIAEKQAKEANEANALFNNWMLNSGTSDNLQDPAAATPVIPSPTKSRKRQTKLDKELANVEILVNTIQAKQERIKHKLIKNNLPPDLPIEIAVLGKKSFWLESKRKTVEETVMKREETEIYPPIHHQSLMMKKKLFLTNLKLRKDNKYNENMMKTLTK